MIKVGYLVSYDYELIFNSLPTIYNDADSIYLAIDENRSTWSGNNFTISSEFFNRIRSFDKEKKIVIYEDDFYVPELSSMDNEIRERNLLLKKMGEGWLIQLDADEYVCNFNSLANQLRKKKYLTKLYWLLPVTLSGYWVILFKKNNEGFFQITNRTPFNFITNFPKYTGARKNLNYTNINIGSLVLHQAYAREPEEIYQKLKNWGHKDDFDTEKFFNFWSSINTTNYKQVENYHPVVSGLWEKLEFKSTISIEELLSIYKSDEQVDFSKLNAVKILKENFKLKFRVINKKLKRVLRRMSN